MSVKSRQTGASGRKEVGERMDRSGQAGGQVGGQTGHGAGGVPVKHIPVTLKEQCVLIKLFNHHHLNNTPTRSH